MPNNSKQPDRLDEILQEMLIQYTAWINGEPVAWNVKKAKAKAAIEAYILNILNNIEQSVKQHTVPEGSDLVTRSYVLNTIEFERAALTERHGISERTYSE